MGDPLPFQYTESQTVPRTEVRDPCIIREGDTYHLVFTMWPFGNREEKRLDRTNQGGSPGIAPRTGTVRSPSALSLRLARLRRYWPRRFPPRRSPCAKSDCYPRGVFVVPKGVLPDGYFVFVFQCSSCW